MFLRQVISPTGSSKQRFSFFCSSDRHGLSEKMCGTPPPPPLPLPPLPLPPPPPPPPLLLLPPPLLLLFPHRTISLQHNP